MNKIVAILKTIRILNLLMMGLSMYFVRFFIFNPHLKALELSNSLTSSQFALLVISSLLIAAGGYFINDYFDLKIDQINKPKENYFNSLLDRRGAIIIHFILNFIAVAIGLYLAIVIGKYKLILLQLIPIGLLWFYSTNYKKQFLVGNFVIAFLSILIVLVPAFYEKVMYPPYFPEELQHVFLIFKLLGIYGICIFLLTLVREVVKDMEDIEGDQAYACRTMPIVWGISKSKIYTFLLKIIFVLFVSYLSYQLYLLNYLDFFYMTIVFLSLPMSYTFYLLFMAKEKKDFTQISTFYKYLILIGILSMYKVSFLVP